MKYVFVLIFGCSFVAAISSFRSVEDTFVRVDISEEISVSLPESFKVMTADQMQQKFLSARPPLAAYTSANQVADFSVSAANTRWRADDLPMLKDFYRSSLLELYDEVDFIEEGIREVDKTQVAFFEFTSVVKQDEDAITPKPPVHRYTYAQYTIRQNKALVFTFSCPRQRQSQWQPIAQKVMESVKLK
ncbi:hypothetical protein [Tunicatimonas pelagia]|uniref:hypothetical protein n=1 Tax=Tunicatimonas pelagia TaxID=931531 RepID=UPI002666FC9B|nr:hypothetical protein [Tunicatimonas pelagia]WKN46145.1 hypothetical protein P0M28_14415 [Tunicatimonas pelagia]